MRWYGSRISADRQQILFSSKHDAGGIFSPVTSLGEQKKEHGTEIASLNMGDYFEKIC